MYAALRELMKPEIEEAERIGMERGIERGITRGGILALHELGYSVPEIAEKMDVEKAEVLRVINS